MNVVGAVLVLEQGVMGGYVFLFQGNPGGQLAQGRTLLADVGGVALRTHHADFVEHTIKLHAGGSIKGLAVTLGRELPDDHHSGRDRAFAFYSHQSPIDKSSSS